MMEVERVYARWVGRGEGAAMGWRWSACTPGGWVGGWQGGWVQPCGPRAHERGAGCSHVMQVERMYERCVCRQGVPASVHLMYGGRWVQHVTEIGRLVGVGQEA